MSEEEDEDDEDDPEQLTQIGIVCGFLKSLGDRTISQQAMNAIIEAANVVMDDIATTQPKRETR